MTPIVTARILELELESINHLAEESLSQGFWFVERLIQDYRQGLNCFDQSGEILLTASVQGEGYRQPLTRTVMPQVFGEDGG